MKKYIDSICAVVALTFIIIIYGIAGYFEINDTFIGEVISIENNIVSVEANNQVWSFEGDGFEVGDIVKCYVMDCGTLTLADDEITEVRIVESH